MIRHIVLIKFRKDVSEQEIASAFRQIASIQTVVDGMRAVTSGKSESPEKIERGYMHGFVADFRDGAALAAYQQHPDHKRAGAELVRLAEGGLDGILVFDLPVDELPGASSASFNS